MTEFVDVDATRERSGRERRLPKHSETHGHSLRGGAESAGAPDFETFLHWLRSSDLSPVPVKTFAEVVVELHKVAVIQERVCSLSPEDEEVLRELHSLDDLPPTWSKGVSVNNSRELTSRVMAGAKPPGAVQVIDALDRSELVAERLGDVILVENSSFRAFHVDVDEVGHSFSTLATGRKLWMFCLPSSMGKELDVIARDRRHSFSRTIQFVQGLSKTRARQIFWCLLEPGCTVYFPYLYMHSVWTDVQPGTVSVMWACERLVSDEWESTQRGLAEKYLALGRRRGAGPSSD